MVTSTSELLRSRELLGGYARALPADSAIQRNASIPFARVIRGLPNGLPFCDLSREHSGWILIVSMVCVFLALVLRQPPLLLLPILFILVARRVHQIRQFKVVESFERDYPAFLLSLASGIRTGLDPFVALCKSGDLFSPQSPIQRELARLVEAAAQGKSEEESVRIFAASIPHPDLDLFRAAFILSRREGASLADALQRLARVTRQRQSFRRKVRSAIAMQKLSAIGIALCAVVIGLMQTVSNPGAFRIALAHPVGSKALVAGCCLIAIGLLWMLSLARSRL